MRKIEFKAWDKSDNTMSKVLLLWCGNNGYGVQLLKPNGDISMNTTAIDIEILEYSGIDDKNGNKIYEGDLVEFWHTPIDKGGAINNKNLKRCKTKAEIIFKWGMFCLKHADGYENKYPLFGEYEVVGNIYENKDWKELL